MIIKKLFVRCCLSLIVSSFFCGFLSAQEKVADKSQSEDEKKAIKTSQSVESTETPVKQRDQQQSQPQQQNQSQKVAPKPTFDILEYRVKGNTVLSGKTIELALTSFLGPHKTEDDLQKAADALERAYRDNGYPAVYVNIPPQDVVGGIVYLDAVEGKIARLKISDANYFALSEIKEQVPSLREDEALYLPSLQKEVNHLNSLSADLNVIPILKPGKLPGTLDVELKVRDSLPVHGDITLNNHHSKNTTETRLGASLRYDNLWQKQHGLGLQVQISPEDTSEVNVLSVTYIMPWKKTKNRMVFYGVKSESEVDVNLASDSGDSLSVFGDSNIFGFRFVKPLASTAKYIHSLSLGFDYKDVVDRVQIRTDMNNLDDDTPINYVSWTAQYNATQRAKTTTIRYGLSLNFSLNGIGGSDEDDFDNRSLGALPNFFYLQGNYRRQDFFSGDWSLSSQLRFQLTDSRLISNEQIRAGGANSVRGYFESQQGGDIGSVLRFELQTPSLVSKKKYIQDLRATAFIEGASLTIKRFVINSGNAIPGGGNNEGETGANENIVANEQHFDLASIGLGLKAQINKKLFIDTYWALPLKEDCSQPGCTDETDIDNNNPKFIFNMSYQF